MYKIPANKNYDHFSMKLLSFCYMCCSSYILGNRQGSRVCVECRWKKVTQSGLCQKQCLTGKHNPLSQRAVIVDEVHCKLIHLHCPPAKPTNVFKHEITYCDKGSSWTSCGSPHSEQEVTIWNLLQKEDQYTPRFELLHVRT